MSKIVITGIEVTGKTLAALQNEALSLVMNFAGPGVGPIELIPTSDIAHSFADLFSCTYRAEYTPQ